MLHLSLQGGNNNTYCHDSPLNWFDWEKAAADTKGFARYFQCLVNFRCGAYSLISHSSVWSSQLLGALKRKSAVASTSLILSSIHAVLMLLLSRL